MEFIEVVNNAYLAHDGLYRCGISREIIRIDDLLKVFRYHGDEREWIIAYVFNDPVLGGKREFHEYLLETEFKNKWQDLCKKLTGISRVLWYAEDEDFKETVLKTWEDDRIAEIVKEGRGK